MTPHIFPRVWFPIFGIDHCQMGNFSHNFSAFVWGFDKCDSLREAWIVINEICESLIMAPKIIYIYDSQPSI